MQKPKLTQFQLAQLAEQRAASRLQAAATLFAGMENGDHWDEASKLAAAAHNAKLLESLLNDKP